MTDVLDQPVLIGTAIDRCIVLERMCNVYMQSFIYVRDSRGYVESAISVKRQEEILSLHAAEQGLDIVAVIEEVPVNEH